MHWLGKTFTWLSLIGFIAAVVLMGRMIQIRNSWVKKVEDLRAEAEKNEPEVHKRRKQLVKVTDELHLTLLGWNQYWDNTAVTRGPAARGALIAQIGSNVGLRADQTVYVFQPAASGNGAVEYLGAFRISQLEENRAAMLPTWRLRPDEENSWRYGQGWRIWESIPPSARQLFSDLDVNFVLADERNDALTRNLQLQQELDRDAQQQLDQRMAELVGGGQLPPGTADELPAHLVIGLVNAIQQAEDSRNDALIRVDRLRRQVKAATERYQQLQQENLQLAAKLAGTAPVSSAPSAAPLPPVPAVATPATAAATE